jgi:hypothetical protein
MADFRRIVKIAEMLEGLIDKAEEHKEKWSRRKGSMKGGEVRKFGEYGKCIRRLQQEVIVLQSIAGIAAEKADD